MRTILPIAAAALLLAACGESPVQPEAFDVPEASFANEESGGENNSFVIGQGWKMNADNGRGSTCRAQGLGDADDFIRLDRRGGESVHFKEVEGSLLIVQDGVVAYEGTAKISANWYYPDGYGNGLGHGSAKAFATFDSPDGKGKTKALCAIEAPRAGFAWAVIAVW